MDYTETPDGQFELEQIEQDHNAIQRDRNDFIVEVVAVCEKYGVELCCDWEEQEASGVELPEFCGGRVATGWSWIVDVGDLERAIRLSK